MIKIRDCYIEQIVFALDQKDIVFSLKEMEQKNLECLLQLVSKIQHQSFYAESLRNSENYSWLVLKQSETFEVRYSFKNESFVGLLATQLNRFLEFVSVFK